MGDPLYLADPTTPDERDRVVRGIEKTLPAPAQAALYHLLPNANYVYDPMLRMWVPQEQAASSLVVLLKQLAAYGEDSAETLSGVINSWLSAIKRQGVPTMLYGTTAPRVRTVTDGDLIQADGTRQGTPFTYDLGSLDSNARRKFLGVDAGAYVSPGAGGTQITFTGELLVGRLAPWIINVTDRMKHEVTAIVDPAGGGVGTITVRPAIPTASAVFILPYTATPHAWNSAADALQTLAVVGDPPRINGPATFISVNAALAANFQYIIPCALYGRYQIEIYWYSAAALSTTQLQFNIYGRYSDAAWDALGAIPAGYSQNSKFQTIAGVAFGAPPVAGGAALVSRTVLVARMQEPEGFNSFVVEMNSINRDANAVVVVGTYRLMGGTA